jgi:hypothetical protein
MGYGVSGLDMRFLGGNWEIKRFDGRNTNRISHLPLIAVQALRAWHFVPKRVMDGLPWDRWMVEEESEACGGEEIVEVEKQISPLRSSQSTRAASVEMTICSGVNEVENNVGWFNDRCAIQRRVKEKG